jgi:ribose transport system substrate-binding protein
VDLSVAGLVGGKEAMRTFKTGAWGRQAGRSLARAAGAGTILAMTGIALSACGSSSSDSTSTSASTSAAAAAGTSSTASAGNDCVSTAQASVAKATAQLKPPSPGPNIDVSKNKGKHVWLVTSLQNPLASAVQQGFRDGTKAAGLDGHIFEGQGTTTSWNSGVAQAIAQHASVIVIYGITDSLVSAELAHAKAAGITVIDGVQGDPDDPLTNGVYAHVTGDFSGDGALAADYILAQSGCKANVGVFGGAAQAVHVLMQKGAGAEFAKLCPSCNVYQENVDLTTIATAVEPQVATLLQRHPDINWLFPVFDGMAPFTLTAVQQVRPSVKVVSHDGVAAQLDQVRAGNTPLVADFAFPPIEWVGWTLVDTAERAMLGDKPGNTTIPSRLIDKANASSSNATLFPAFQNLPGVFEPVWGVQS